MEKIYQTEEEFLKDYDASLYEKLSITADDIIFSIATKEQKNYRKLDQKVFSVLLIKRNDFPFKGCWSLPGGFVGIKETIDEAAKRILKQKTNLENIYMEQLYTYSTVDRDPRMRVISTSYIALIDRSKLKDKLSQDAAWFQIQYTETKDKVNVTLKNENEQIKFVVEKKLKEKTTNQYDYVIKENGGLAFDHAMLIVSALQRLKNKIEYTDIIFNIMPEYFTLSELQNVYELILNKPLLKPAFRRVISKKVEKTDKMLTGEGHRPSVLYRYKG